MTNGEIFWALRRAYRRSNLANLTGGDYEKLGQVHMVGSNANSGNVVLGCNNPGNNILVAIDERTNRYSDDMDSDNGADKDRRIA